MSYLLIIRSNADAEYSLGIIKSLHSLQKKTKLQIMGIDTIPIGSDIEETMLQYLDIATHALIIITVEITCDHIVLYREKLQANDIMTIGIYANYVDDALKDAVMETALGIIPTEPIEAYANKARAYSDIANVLKILLHQK